MRYNLANIDKERYLQMPKALFSDNEMLKKLGLPAKVAYSFLRERISLSSDNPLEYTDINGDIFVFFTCRELGAAMQVSKSTANRAIQELKKVGLIEAETIWTGKGRERHQTQKIYVNKLPDMSIANRNNNINELGGTERRFRAGLLEKEAQARIEEVLASTGERLTLAEAKVQILKELRERSVSGTHSVPEAERAASETQCVPSEGCPRSASGTHPVPQAGHIETYLKSKTDLERLTGKEDITTATIRACGREAEVVKPAQEAGKRQTDAYSTVVGLYLENMNPEARPLQLEMLGDLCDTYTPQWVEAAIREALATTEGGKRASINYLRSILERWQAEGFKSDRRKHCKAREPREAGRNEVRAQVEVPEASETYETFHKGDYNAEEYLREQGLL